jgi:hypothetical protein
LVLISPAFANLDVRTPVSGSVGCRHILFHDSSWAMQPTGRRGLAEPAAADTDLDFAARGDERRRIGNRPTWPKGTRYATLPNNLPAMPPIHGTGEEPA